MNAKRRFSRFLETIIGYRAHRLAIIRLLRLRQECEQEIARFEIDLDEEDDPLERVFIQNSIYKCRMRIHAVSHAVILRNTL